MKIKIPFPISLSSICRIVGGHFLGNEISLDTSVQYISTDTRGDVSGSIFIPLRGKRFDGHNFIAEAGRCGAIASICSREKRSYVQALNISIPIILVDDTHEAFLKIGEFVRDKVSPYVIAVGGSAGKTTTKELIYFILSHFFRTQKSEKSFNNEIGLAISMASLRYDTEVAVLEIGTSKPGEVAYLSRFVKPHCAVLVSVGKEHLEGLGDENGVINEEISLLISSKGHVISSIENDVVRKFFLELQDVLKIGIMSESVFSSEIVKMHVNDKTIFFIFAPHNVENFRTVFRIKVFYGDVKDNRFSEFYVKTSLAPHFGVNITSAIAVLYVLSQSSQGSFSSVDSRLGFFSHELASIDFSKFLNEKGRFSVLEVGDIFVIDDTYNSNPLSVSALFYSSSFHSGRKIFVLGDMLELGLYSADEHRRLGELAKKYLSSSDTLFIVSGEYAFFMDQGFNEAGFECKYISCRDDIIPYLSGIVKSGDAVFFKASRACGFEKLVSDFINLRNSLRNRGRI